MARPVEFVLVPDGSAARRVRRALASRHAWTGVMVGTWDRLVERSLAAYAIAEPPATGDDFAAALGSATGAFWSESFAAAPEETAAAVEAAYSGLAMASDPKVGPAGIPAGTTGRLKHRLADLRRLAATHPNAIPSELQAIRLVINSPHLPSVPLRVRTCDGVPHLTRWQRAMVGRLNADSAGKPHPRAAVLDRILGDCLAPVPSAARGTALRAVQERLFELDAPAVSLDGTLQWMGLRDHYQEAEIAAGIAQGLLAEDSGLKPSEIGLLVPDSFEYSVALADAFGLAGLLLAGLHGERWKRDLGREAVFHFLHCRQRPAPAMALAECFSSRLMPWSREVGGQLAQTVMDGDFSPKLPSEASHQAVAMRELLLGGDERPATLARALADFARLLNGGEHFAPHAKRAAKAADLVRAELEGAGAIDWAALRNLVTPTMLTNGGAPSFSVEGVTIWRERQEPWRPVRHLIVLGFSDKRYPARVGTSSVFSPFELAHLRDRLGLPIDLPARREYRARMLFRRQLRAVSQSATFLLPHLTLSGDQAGVSDSLLFMQRLIADPSPSGLVAMLDSAAGRARIRNLASVAVRPMLGPRFFLPGSDQLQFGRDLMSLRRGERGKTLPQSPTSLETLMVSPLAWLLRSLGAEPREWRPESAGPLVAGSLVHGVFDELFRPGRALPASPAVPVTARIALETLAKEQAPFLRSPHWALELRALSAGTARAAEAWHAMLERLDARVLGTETWLEGSWNGVALHGKADVILELRDSQLLIVDYKWSSSSSRMKRMAAGYDSQIELYRHMASSGRVHLGAGQALPANSKSEGASEHRIATAYFTMRDRVCLTARRTPALQGVPGRRTVAVDPSKRAMTLIKRQVSRVRAGAIPLNSTEDRQYFERRCSVPTFALDISPLVELFLVD